MSLLVKNPYFSTFFRVFWIILLEKSDGFAILYPISSHVRQLVSSPRALSLGAALFLVAVAIGSKPLINNDIPSDNLGVLGGPVAIAAIKTDAIHLPVNVVMGTEDPAGVVSRGTSDAVVVDLSTGTLDGTQPFQAISGNNDGNSPSLLESNEKAIKAVAALASPDAVNEKISTHYFIQPTSGKNWGVLHDHNAVDIANSCGTPVLAAAEGEVVSDSNLGSGASGWNGGYGRFVLIKHPNGTKTRYAHLSKIYVSVGDEVGQGQEIGEIGNNGNVNGATGCHLHFEVIGGANPFIRK